MKDGVEGGRFADNKYEISRMEHEKYNITTEQNVINDDDREECSNFSYISK